MKQYPIFFTILSIILIIIPICATVSAEEVRIGTGQGLGGGAGDGNNTYNHMSGSNYYLSNTFLVDLLPYWDLFS